MPTPNLGLNQPAAGAQDWDEPLNENFDLIDAHASAANHATAIATAVTNHEGAANPHPTYETSAEAAQKVTDHEAAANPHPTYETSAEAQAKVDAHAAAGDPHPTYLTQAEGDARYGQLGADNTWTQKNRIALASDERGLEIKRVAGQTKNLLTFLSEESENGSETGVGSAVLARISSAGDLGLAASMHLSPGNNDNNEWSGTYALWLQPKEDVIHIVADQLAGGSSDFLTFRRSDATSAMRIVGDTNIGSLNLYAADGTTVAVGLGANDAAAGSVRAIARAITAGTVGLIVVGAASQTADIQRWSDTLAGTILSRVNKGGYFMTRKVAAPADADIATSELAFWFDNTVGAAKAMFKGKNSAGTVVSGSVALS